MQPLALWIEPIAIHPGQQKQLHGRNMRDSHERHVASTEPAIPRMRLSRGIHGKSRRPGA